MRPMRLTPFKAEAPPLPTNFFRGEMKVGTVYMVRGGHILRYRGLYANNGPCLAFGPSMDVGPFDIPVGYSTIQEHVLRPITRADLEWLPERRAQLHARKLPTEEIDHLIAELEQS